ncbi:uracil-DNA glycosylase family protein [Tautonia plasticadhaerens]|uniref:Uracil DNA glycosylase superfamily protein n=1 Tax=Tautonia plasticadhaerens TaxID=2527974 RepID=A0A518GXL0_9BACT|nr:uracil-DNA glycosylase family protein [Tautonia plasticadhaerens]QDV33330.1 Uracil DNA glycosylase superfamily protein [Tautonia plasticadhaerens]
MSTVDELIEAIHQEALRADFPIDEPVYLQAKKDPRRPILFAGSLSAPICSFGRDLGKDEVAWGQPQVGAGGKLVRREVYRKYVGEPTADDPRLDRALEHVLLSNTVPYKPPGNKAYSEAVKARFRPYVAEFLAGHWEGDRVLCLGTEAFRWFAPYAGPGAADDFWNREDRYEAELPCELVAGTPGGEIRKALIVCPLPHPSPLNRRWYPLFPGLLRARLDASGAG